MNLKTVSGIHYVIVEGKSIPFTNLEAAFTLLKLLNIRESFKNEKQIHP